jgi:GT2 family glycosyltransferase
MIPGSAAATTDAKSYAYKAAEKALQDRLNREHNKGKVQKGLWTGSYRLRRSIDDGPLVSIILPFKDKPEYLQRCLDSIMKSSYRNFEILLISNNSEEKETFSVVNEFLQQDARIKFHEYNQPFNYSAINNWGASQANGDYLLFLNNDTEVINFDWIEAMLEQAARQQIGAVGAKLLYSDKTIQHAGVILGIVGVANHAFRHLPNEQHGYFGYSNVIRNYSAVTAACLMLQAIKFWEVDGFDEEHLAISYNDVDLCLKLLKKGYRNVYTPYARLYHYESVSRESDKQAPEGERFSGEKEFMLKKWGNLIKNDPYYNTNLTLEREDYSLRV